MFLGLNVVSEFNVENVTIFGTKDDMTIANSFSQDKDDQMEVDDIENPKQVSMKLIVDASLRSCC